MCLYVAMHTYRDTSRDVSPMHMYRDISLNRQIDRSIHLPTSHTLSLSLPLSIYRSIDLSVDLPIYRSTYLSVCLSIYLSVDLSRNRQIDTY